MINEVASGVVPFSDCTKARQDCHTVLELGYGMMELQAAVAVEGLRPIIYGNTLPATLVGLLHACWRADPQTLPTMPRSSRPSKISSRPYPWSPSPSPEVVVHETNSTATFTLTRPGSSRLRRKRIT